ncbi:MAG: hypothetical protein NTZ94_18595 [Verrucomicrobia bacterium]|nr:hypothetical protein [Verrucomicrobiota bacterium]
MPHRKVGEAGTCRLCREVGKPLKRSHLLPHGAYKLARDGRPQKLVLMTPKRVQTTDSELKTKLLCADCEQKLNTNGEKWVLGNLRVQEQEFPIRKMITNADSSFLAAHGDWAVYDAKRVPNLLIEKLEYFALSVFWRAGQKGWPNGYEGIKLGPYEAILREYLLDPTILVDSKMSLIVQVHAKEEVIHRPLQFPFTDRYNGSRVHEFRIPGLTCRLIISHSGNSSEFQLGCLMKSKTIMIAKDSSSFIAYMGKVIKNAKVANNLKH